MKREAPVWLGLVAKPDALASFAYPRRTVEGPFLPVAPPVGLIALVSGALSASFDLSGTVQVQSR